MRPNNRPLVTEPGNAGGAQDIYWTWNIDYLVV
jgi:hypothetical protein